MAETLGMNPERVAAQTALIAGQVAMLSSISGEIAQTGRAARQPSLFGLISGDAVMTLASVWLAESAAADVHAAIAAANELLGRVQMNIAEQVDASSANEGARDARLQVARSDAAALYRSLANNPDALAGKTPHEVRAWWDLLTPEQQNSLVSDQHWLMGNTNGIPFDRRVEANRLSAQEMLAAGGLSDTQREYLELVAGSATTEPTVRLISFDPNADRIIEMIGDMGEQTNNIVNFVPGTTADMEGFYNSSTQQLGLALADDANPPGSTVVFVYKDSPFPTFNVDGVYHNEWAESVGSAYVDFNLALGQENTRAVPVTSIEHSFASSVGGYAKPTAFTSRTASHWAASA